MKKISLIVVAILLSITIGLVGCGNKQDLNQNSDNVNNQHYGGWIPDSDEKFASFAKAKIEKIGVNPTAVDLSEKFPTPGSQGMQSSCTAWATAYALKTYLEKVDFGWDQNQKEHQFSPAYVYNQINDGVDEGAAISDAMDLIVKQGVCTLATMSYDYKDYKTQPNSAQKAEAAKFKSASWGTVSAGNIEEFKTQLASGNAIVAGIPVYDDFDNLSKSNSIYDNTSGEKSGAHAICFVGYDDNKQAFKLINSWGKNWGIDGYGYMSYQLVTDLKIRGYVMQDIKNNNITPTPTSIPTPTSNPNPNPEPVKNKPSALQRFANMLKGGFRLLFN